MRKWAACEKQIVLRLPLGKARSSRIPQPHFSVGSAADDEQVQVRSNLISAFKACSGSKDLQAGKKIHSDAIQSGNHTSVFVASAAVDMYAKCGSMLEARRVFDSLQGRDVVLWNALLLGYVKNGEPLLALEIFELMQRIQECEPNDRSYVALFMACGSLAAQEQGDEIDGRPVKLKSLEKAMEIHSGCRFRWQDQLFMGNSLVDMYGKCGSLLDSRAVFDKMISYDVVSWNVLILSCVENGKNELAMEVFGCMKRQGHWLPNARTYVAALTACANCAVKEQGELVNGKIVKLCCLETGMAVHSEASNSSSLDIYLGNALVDLYSKCLSLFDARSVFDRMVFHDVVSWTSLVLGYADNGESDLALQLFSCMKTQGCLELDAGAYVAALTACSSLAEDEQGEEIDGRRVKIRCLEKVREIHAQATEETFFNPSKNSVVQNCLMDLYSRCGCLVEARAVFDKIVAPDAASWNALMVGYEENGHSDVALELYAEMIKIEAVEMNSRSFVAALKACASSAGNSESKNKSDQLLQTGTEIYSQATKRNFHRDLFVGSATVHMFMKCGSLADAQRVFDSFGSSSQDVVLWTALISGYADNGEADLALEAFQRMQQQENCKPNCRTFDAALSACSSRLDKVLEIHSLVVKAGCETDAFIANRLVVSYSRCGSLVDARRVFDVLPKKQQAIATCTALMQGYTAIGQGRMALEIFTSMSCGAADSGAFVAAIGACGSVSDVEAGIQIHAGVCRSGFESSSAVATSLMDFYGKCGRMTTAQLLFDGMGSSSGNGVEVPWNALLNGYSHKGESDQVLKLFGMMRDEGVEADEVTFVSVLSVCSHSGMIDLGKKVFQAMQSGYGVFPCLEHYTCMVDLLGRAKRLDEALEMVKGMAMEADALVWTALLGACWKWKNAEVGKIAFDGLLAVDTEQAAGYVLMSNIYETLSMWEDKHRVQQLRLVLNRGRC